MAKVCRLIGALLLVCASATAVLADIPPKGGGQFPAGYRSRRAAKPETFTFKRAYKPQITRMLANRRALFSGALSMAAASAAPGGIAVQGERTVPVLAFKYANTASDPYATSGLETRLFGSSGDTMTKFYSENSFGLLKVTGSVTGWFGLAKNDTFYEGADTPEGPCNGVCNGAKTAQAVKDALAAAEAKGMDYSAFDNDGPDGKPNSGDDDGFVDFVALVHPEAGGECSVPATRKNMWSHRSSLTSWNTTTFKTTKKTPAGRTIVVDDYVIMPAVDCDGTSMIQIGVFAHEFGHAFALPDLYDTNPENGQSAGAGNWCLMAGGSWGGDGSSPERPSNMSAWSKVFLGWVQPVPLQGDITPATFKPSSAGRTAVFKLPIVGNRYYLIEYRPKEGWDAKLPGQGLLVWRIDDDVIKDSLNSNTVNAVETNKGVGLVEADNLMNLDNGEAPCSGAGDPANCGNRGDAGDVFPGSKGKRVFDAASQPKIQGNLAVCNISNPGATMTASLLVSTNSCAPAPPAPPPTGEARAIDPSSHPLGEPTIAPAPGGTGSSDPTPRAATTSPVWALLVLPAVAWVRRHTQRLRR